MKQDKHDTQQSRQDTKESEDLKVTMKDEVASDVDNIVVPNDVKVKTQTDQLENHDESDTYDDGKDSRGQSKKTETKRNKKHNRTHNTRKPSDRKKRIYNITYGTLDLTPTPSLEELEADQQQGKSSIGILAFLMIIMFIGFTMFVATLLLHRSLDERKRRLDSIQRELNGQALKNKKNETLKKRLAIVDQLEIKTYDPKHTLEYWQQRIEGYGTLSSISISQDLTFTIEGNGDSVESLAELWYLLSVDPAVDSVALSSFTAGDDEATFIFNGKLNSTVFSKKRL